MHFQIKLYNDSQSFIDRIYGCSRLTVPDVIVLELLQNDKSIGFAFIHHDELGIVMPYTQDRIASVKWQLVYMQVEKEFKNQGWGTILFQECISYISKRDSKYIVYILSLPNSTRFWLKRGCIAFSGMDCVWAAANSQLLYCAPTEKLPAVIMEQCADFIFDYKDLETNEAEICEY